MGFLLKPAVKGRKVMTKESYLKLVSKEFIDKLSDIELEEIRKKYDIAMENGLEKSKATRKRIKEIEERALKKLKGSTDDDPDIA